MSCWMEREESFPSPEAISFRYALPFGVGEELFHPFRLRKRIWIGFLTAIRSKPALEYIRFHGLRNVQSVLFSVGGRVGPVKILGFHQIDRFHRTFIDNHAFADISDDD